MLHAVLRQAPLLLIVVALCWARPAIAAFEPNERGWEGSYEFLELAKGASYWSTRSTMPRSSQEMEC
jgi:hypothetical protein